MIFSLPNFQYRLAKVKRYNEEFEKERDEYNKKMTEYRKNHWKQFWEEQTQIENRFLEDWKES